MLAATAIAANFFMMCGLPKMPFRAGETFPSRERRDLDVPYQSSTKIIEMAGAPCSDYPALSVMVARHRRYLQAARS